MAAFFVSEVFGLRSLVLAFFGTDITIKRKIKDHRPKTKDQRPKTEVKKMETVFSRKHLLGIRELEAGEITHLLDTAETFRDISRREIKKVPALRGRTVINLFFESSTRTRTSFEIAAKRLSADAVNISVATSSVSKGETLLDTARNLEAMSPDCIVVRHAQAGAAEMLAGKLAAAVVNAGDGAHEHPTQALLDCSTIRAHKQRIAGLEVAICG